MRASRIYRSSDGFICPDCIDESYLRDIVASAAADDQACSFCATTPAAEFDVFMQALAVGISHEYEQADDAGLPLDHEVRDALTMYTHWDIADAYMWTVATGHADEIQEAIRVGLADDVYVPVTWNRLPRDEAFGDSWQKFREQILRRTRFVFWARRDDRDWQQEVPVAGVLEEIGDLLARLGCITELPAGTVTYRARGHATREASHGWGAADLGTNTAERAVTATRMSPAGIPLFYGAENASTALAEVSRSDAREFFTVGKFRATAPVTVLDLTSVPETPSIFDPGLGQWRGEIKFLNDLVNELRRPVDEDRGSIDYVPTQVFCEYFLRAFDQADIGGLVWQSAAAADGGTCQALDVPHEGCIGPVGSAAGRIQLRLAADGIDVYQRRSDEFRLL
jgi:hypothetical protein